MYSRFERRSRLILQTKTCMFAQQRMGNVLKAASGNLPGYQCREDVQKQKFLYEELHCFSGKPVIGNPRLQSVATMKRFRLNDACKACAVSLLASRRRSCVEFSDPAAGVVRFLVAGKAHQRVLIPAQGPLPCKPETQVVRELGGNYFLRVDGQYTCGASLKCWPGQVSTRQCPLARGE